MAREFVELTTKEQFEAMLAHRRAALALSATERAVLMAFPAPEARSGPGCCRREAKVDVDAIVRLATENIDEAVRMAHVETASDPFAGTVEHLED